jgi:hypothetical protein
MLTTLSDNGTTDSEVKNNVYMIDHINLVYYSFHGIYVFF